MITRDEAYQVVRQINKEMRRYFTGDDRILPGIMFYDLKLGGLLLVQIKFMGNLVWSSNDAEADDMTVEDVEKTVKEKVDVILEVLEWQRKGLKAEMWEKRRKG